MKSLSLVLALPIALLTLSAHAADPVKKAGGVLVDSKGMTVYTYDKDAANSGKSVCTDRCAANWPPVTAGDAQLSAPYSAVTRDDGSKQVAYNGKPLYTFVKDKKAGDKTGDNVGSVWHVVSE